MGTSTVVTMGSGGGGDDREGEEERACGMVKTRNTG
jgi:hypothetical protein